LNPGAHNAHIGSAMTEFDRILSLVDSVGEPGFEGAYFAVFDDLLDLWSCTAFEFRRNAPPRCILAAAPNKESVERVKSNAQRYVQRGYKDDPNLRFAEAKGGTGIEIRSLADAEFDDDSYRSRYFGRASTRDKVFILSADDDRVIYANFYRGNFQPCFDEDDKKKLQKYAKLCISFLSRHIKFSGRSVDSAESFFEESPALRQIRYQQVLGLLSGFQISPREAEVCAMIVIGHTTQGISIDLGISKNTVVTHRRRAYEKLGICSQNELFGKCFDSLSAQN
jgi:DNA-binding CsgD family transcriptional regulator